MKRYFLCFLFCVVSLLSGCSFVLASSLTTAESFLALPEKMFAGKQANTQMTDAALEEVHQQYALLYDAPHIFTDMYSGGIAWLIGEDYFVQLISVADFHDVSVIRREYIVRIEQAVYTDSALVTIVDRSGKALSLAIRSEALFALAGVLK